MKFNIYPALVYRRIVLVAYADPKGGYTAQDLIGMTDRLYPEFHREDVDQLVLVQNLEEAKQYEKNATNTR